MKHDPQLIPSHRYCVVQPVSRFNRSDIQRRILRGEPEVQTDFRAHIGDAIRRSADAARNS